MDTDLLKALAEPNRLRIVELLLERPHAVLDIAERLGLQQPQVSKHLKVLVDAGLVGTFPWPSSATTACGRTGSAS